MASTKPSAQKEYVAIIKHAYIEQYGLKMELEKRLAESTDKTYTRTVKEMLELKDEHRGTEGSKDPVAALNMEKVRDQLKLLDKQLEGQENNLKHVVDRLEKEIRGHRVEDSIFI